MYKIGIATFWNTGEQRAFQTSQRIPPHVRNLLFGIFWNKPTDWRIEYTQCVNISFFGVFAI